jgi:hypothetical protein
MLRRVSPGRTESITTRRECLGLYGTMSYSVARQVGEIGIRMALGAQRGAVAWMVLRRVLLLAAVGLAISVPAAFARPSLSNRFCSTPSP